MDLDTSPSRGRHRAPSRTGRRLGRIAAVLSAGAPVIGLGAGITALTAPVAHAETDWDALAKCESGGDWGIDTGNGFSGGLQFTPSTWRAFGGSGNAEDASRAEQIAVAEKVKAAQGMNAWPTCSKKTGQTSDAPNSSSGSSSSGSDSDDDSDDSGRKTSTKDSGEKDSGKKSSSKKDSDDGVAAARTAPTAEQAADDAGTGSGSSGSAGSSSGGYTVAAGDTLSSIAASHGTSWSALRAANPDVISDPDLILPGWTLQMG